VRGETYAKFKVEAGRKYFLNAGSVGEPRDGSDLANYVITIPHFSRPVARQFGSRGGIRSAAGQYDRAAARRATAESPPGDLDNPDERGPNSAQPLVRDLCVHYSACC
jgi:hypothetical protein